MNESPGNNNFAESFEPGAAVEQPPATQMPPVGASVPIPNTDYFEIESKHASASFAVWVTRPYGYEIGNTKYPAIYVTDGNSGAALFGPHSEANALDQVSLFQPYLLINVGYFGQDAHNALTLRNRDLVPPAEPVSEGMAEAVAEDARLGGWTEEEHAEYLRSISDGHADKFLAFLEEELRPVIESRYRVSDEAAGLFGYSYGGLFTLYAMLKRTPMFSTFGAGSPGVLASDSQIFSLQRALREKGEHFDDVRLHITITEAEMTGPSRVFRELGIQFVSLINELKISQFPGLSISSQVTSDETHVTGSTASFFSYLRACYAE